jgi:branched-chain amino acid transport system permease protein
MLAGVAGHMWTMQRGFVNPELIGWHHSAEALLMILLGGLTTLHGPIIGALAFTALDEFSQLVTERKLLVEGLVILFVVLALPNGLSSIALPSWLRLRWMRRIPGPTAKRSPSAATTGARPHA